MNHLEGDDYGNFHYEEYNGPLYFKCKCDVFDTDSHKIEDGDTCENCDMEFKEVTDDYIGLWEQ
jgi:hypothetical protein